MSSNKQPADVVPMSLRVGVNCSPEDLAATLSAYPGMALSRVFGPPGKAIPKWTGTVLTALRAAHVLPFVSFKDWADDKSAVTMVSAWMDTIDSDVWLTYKHEPEDMDSNEWRRRWTIFAPAVRAHKNAHLVRLVPITGLWPARHKIGDRYNPDWRQWIGAWQQWAPCDKAGNYLGDYMGWDCYLEVGSTAYPAPELFFRTPVGAAATMGVPLVIPELAALKTATDPTGTTRAAWIADSIQYLTMTGVQAVCWWDALGTTMPDGTVPDYRLTDSASAAAWRGAVAGNRSYLT